MPDHKLIFRDFLEKKKNRIFLKTGSEKEAVKYLRHFDSRFNFKLTNANVAKNRRKIREALTHYRAVTHGDVTAVRPRIANRKNWAEFSGQKSFQKVFFVKKTSPKGRLRKNRGGRIYENTGIGTIYTVRLDDDLLIKDFNRAFFKALESLPVNPEKDNLQFQLKIGQSVIFSKSGQFGSIEDLIDVIKQESFGKTSTTNLVALIKRENIDVYLIVIVVKTKKRRSNGKKRNKRNRRHRL